MTEVPLIPDLRTINVIFIRETRVVFRTHSNIFYFGKSSIEDIQLGSKYASASCLLDNFAKFLGKHPSDGVFLKPTAVPENG